MAKFIAQNKYEKEFFRFLNPFVTQETVGAFGVTLFLPRQLRFPIRLSHSRKEKQNARRSIKIVSSGSAE